MDNRDRLLEVTARVFAEAGYRGTTTRRVAQEAGVNEVTLFRHFRSKDELIREAIYRLYAADLPQLPEVPADPARELLDWALAYHDHVDARRSVHRRLMGEAEEHPEIMDPARACNDYDMILRYLRALGERGLVEHAHELDTAAGMLLGTLFTVVMFRGVMPDIPPRDAVVPPLVTLVLRAIGARVPEGTP